MTLLLLLACADVAPLVPSAYMPAGLTEDTASTDPAALEAALTAAFARLPTLHAGPVFEGLDAGMAQADASCPTVIQGVETQWVGGCETAAGVRFVGHGATTEGDGRTLFMEGRIESDQRFAAAGSAGQRSSGDTWAGDAWSRLDGAFAWTGVGEGWLADGTSPALEVRLGWNGEVRSAWFDGAVGFPDGAVLALRLDALSVHSGACPSGGLSVRAEEGWRTLTPTDGCCWTLDDGAVICPDPAPLLGWPVPPW